MIRCLKCVMPNTRPDTPFVDGICSACISYAKRPEIDWDARKAQLLRLLDMHNGICLVPSSGGKDSHYQVLKLLELGAHPLVVTASTCHLTGIGRQNIDNLARYATTIEVTPNRSVRAKLNRLGLGLVGDISWPEHVSIFTTPFRVACETGIPLIFYGENPQNQYGGPPGTEEAQEMTLRWRSEFGGFLGLRPQDMIGREGITEHDMRDYTPPSALTLEKVGVQAYFLGQFIPWDSGHNAILAVAHGMQQQLPCAANWWIAENLDNAQTGIHDYMMWLKYGYGRGCAQISVDVRRGKIERDFALSWVQQNDGAFPYTYMGYPIKAVLDRIGRYRNFSDSRTEYMSRREFNIVCDKFTNWNLFRRVIDDENAPPILFY